MKQTVYCLEIRFPNELIRCVRRMSAETQLSALEGKAADIGGINILKTGRLQHLLTSNDLHSL